MISIVKLAATFLLVLSLTNDSEAVKLKSVQHVNTYLNPTKALLNSFRRFVVTNTNPYEWKLLPWGGHYQIISAKGENLYAAEDVLKFDPNSRSVLTWLAPWDNREKRGLWDLEYDGDTVYIRNVQYNEYLSASGNEPRIDGYARVFTRPKSLANKVTKGAWKIIP